MKRREFALQSLAASAGAGLSAAETGTAKPQLLELRRYRFRSGPMETRFNEYAKTALLPAYGRLGVKPIGVFTTLVGPDSPASYMLIPHASGDALSGLAARIAEDPEYRKAAQGFRALPPNDPPYVRRESSLMVAFDSVPQVVPPSGVAAVPGRIFELRTYESHNESAGLKKIEMFEKMGEIAIFKRVGLSHVFFGRNLVGPNLPSLTYMLVFADVAAREKTWAAFREDAEWVKLRSTPGYSNGEIVSNITNVLLRPTDFSQI
jgi:hypothetical protein